MTRTIAALTIALLISAGTEAEAQTGEWEIRYPKDEWGDPNGDKIAHQRATATLAINGGNEVVMASLFVICVQSESLDLAITTPQSSRHPNLEKDESGKARGRPSYSVPAKIDGNKTELAFGYVGDIRERQILFRSPERLIEAKESLEILFAWGSDGQRQSLAWSMDGLREVFPEVCGEEAEGETVTLRLGNCDDLHYSKTEGRWAGSLRCLRMYGSDPETHRGYPDVNVWYIWPSRPKDLNWSFPMDLTCPAAEDFGQRESHRCRAKGRTYRLKRF